MNEFIDQYIGMKHFIVSLILIFGYATGGTVFLQVSFLELPPTYMCSNHTTEFLEPYKCLPHRKDNITGFCGTKI